jgi:hypothetical protein
MMDTSKPAPAAWLAPALVAFALVTHASPAQAAPPADAGAATEPTNPDSAVDATQAASPAGDSASAAPRGAAANPKPAQAVVETAPVPRAPDAPAQSWFARAPLAVTVGSGDQRWGVTFYGFVEADYLQDTTRSYDDAMGSSLVARRDTYAGRVGRSQFSMRNTRLGMKFESPTLGGVKPTAVLEADFFGQAHSADTTEKAFYDSPTFRLRHAYFKLQNDYVDVLAGKTYDVFGWQNYFFGCSAEFLGLPNQTFSRNTQFRLSHEFHGPVSLELAAAASRPAQRDSGIPDVNAGLRFSVDSWQGISTPGNTGTTALPLSIGVSGVARQFKVNAFAPPPAQRSNTTSGWGISLDALVPIIPARDAGDRGNRLTVIGSFVTGSGIADLITANGGATFPALRNSAQANPAPKYEDQDIDNGLVSFDLLGVVHSIDWQTFKLGLQYYLPPSGRVIFAANYTHAHSKNLSKLFPAGGREIELIGRVADTSSYADANLFWDATPAVRFGASGQYTTVSYLDGEKPHNIRGMAQALYVF